MNYSLSSCLGRNQEVKGAFCARSFTGNTTLNVTEIGDSNEGKGNIKKR